MRKGSRGWALGWGLVVVGACNDGGGNSTGFDDGTGPVVTTVETTGGPPTTSTGASSSGEVGTGDTSTGPPTTGLPTTDDSTTTSDGTTSDGTTTTGDGSSSEGGDSTTGELCEAPGLLLECDDKSDDVWHALGLGCEGAAENTLKIANAKFISKPVAFRVARGFGTAEDPNAPGELLFAPREGKKLLVVSTGQLAKLQPDGTLVEAMPQFDNDNNFNADDDVLPAPLSPLVGSNGGQGGTPAQGCDGVNDCSDSIDPNWTLGNKDPNDLLFGAFDITVPGGTHGFGFDVAFFSSEYPEYVEQKFNDMFIGWISSETYTGNVTFLKKQPFTVTSLAEEMEQVGFIGDDPELAGTGFEGHGTTGWVTINWKVEPGETFTFAIAIMDMGDSSKASLAVLDNWHWSCKGCVLETDDPQCGQDGHPKCCGLCVEEEADPKCGTEGHPDCCMAQ